MSASIVIGNIAHFVGEDKTIQFTIYQADGTTVQNITGWSFAFTLHAYGQPTAIYYTKTTGGGGITLTSPTTGVGQVAVARADTAGMYADQYEFDLERTDAGADTMNTKGLYTLMLR